MLFLTFFLLLLPAVASAETAANTDSRAGQIEAERLEKAGNLKPPAPDRFERAVIRVENNLVYKGLTNTSGAGFGLRFGGLETGSSLGFGPQYLRPDLLREKLYLRASASGSFKWYWSADALLSLPRLVNRRLQLDLYALHSDAPQVSYYGPGNDSNQENRTNFRRETSLADFRGVWRVDRRHVLAGATVGIRSYNAGPGASGAYPSADQVFGTLQTPGLDRQSSFLNVGPLFQLDFRDRKNDPRRGTNFVTRYSYWSDRNSQFFSFRRLESAIEQYVPILNEKRVFAFRARTDFSFTESGRQVPFYLQPTLGGADDLRGFGNFRYYDNNRVLMNMEYRWEIAPALEAAIFGDAGRVFAHPEQFSLSHLKESVGIGFRFKTRDSVAFRIDIGVSREGVQIWFKFNGPFQGQGLLHNIL